MGPKDILQFLHEIEKLKSELRHSWLSNGRQESVAEHSRRLGLMVMLMAPSLTQKINIEKALKLSIIHDINEAYVWDIPAFDPNHSKKGAEELHNIQALKKRFNTPIMDEIHDLWLDYENQSSLESTFIKALDKIEVRIQHNEADISTWNDIEFPRSLFAADIYCKYDGFIKEFNELVKLESKNKIINESPRDIKNIEIEAENMRQ